MASLIRFGVATVAAMAFAAPSALALPAVGLTPGGELVRYDTDAPGTILERHAITGLQPGEAIMGLDARPATGQLFALGIVRAANDTGRLYVIDPGTGAATEVGTSPFKNDLHVAEYGFDFTPFVDRIRVVNRLRDNVRLNPDNGALSSTDANMSANDVDALAYDQNVVGTTQTTLWGYNAGNDHVVRVGGVDGGPAEGSANGGMVVPFAGASGIVSTGRTEMDIAPNGTAFLTSQTAGPTYGLYSVNLTAGVVTLVGAFPEAVEDLALLAPSAIELDGGFVSVGEDGLNAAITVRRSGNVSGTQTVHYETADGTAGSSDYTPTSGTITFGPNAATAGFNVPIADDATDEPPEKFTVTLSAPTGGASLGGTSSAEVTILDNDPPPPGPDKVKPKLLLSVPSSLLATTFGRGLKGAFSCSEKCTTSFKMRLGTRTIGKATKKLAGAGKGNFTVKLSEAGKKAVRKAIKRKRRLTISLLATGTDRAGNKGTAKARVLVTRQR